MKKKFLKFIMPLLIFIITGLVITFLVSYLDYKEIIKPKILSFDLDDTLYDNKDIITHAEEEFYQHLKSNYFNNFEFSKEVYNQEKKRLVFELPELSSDVSLLRFFVLYNLLIRNGYSSSEAKKKSKELLQYFIEIRSNINISRETFDVLSSLASKYKLVVLSNGNANFQNKELGNLFDKYRGKAVKKNI